MTRCVVKVPPLLNHALIFSADENSYHGFPDPLRCPETVTRKSVALYYYTKDREVNSRSTNYRARPDTKRSRADLGRQASGLGLFKDEEQAGTVGHPR